MDILFFGGLSVFYSLYFIIAFAVYDMKIENRIVFTTHIIIWLYSLYNLGVSLGIEVLYDKI